VKIRNSFVRSLFALSLLSLMTSAALADTIRLRDGSVLKGKVTSYNQRKFTIVVYIGGTSSQHVVSVDEIESVEFDGAEALATAAPRNTVNPPPAEVSTPAPVVAEPERLVNRDPAPTTPPANDPPSAPANEGDTGLVATLAEKNVSVAAAADWTSTEIRVQKGQRISISASGEIDLGENKRSGPSGQLGEDRRKLIPNRPTGALIAVVGDDNDDFVFVGNSSEFVARHSGILFLSVNEGNLKDNSGAFIARVKVLSGSR
jgi:hypothetical protein